jgi:hypothetical protein
MKTLITALAVTAILPTSAVAKLLAFFSSL